MMISSTYVESTHVLPVPAGLSVVLKSSLSVSGLGDPTQGGACCENWLRGAFHTI